MGRFIGSMRRDPATHKPRGFEKPLGMRDYLPDTVRQMHVVEERARTLFSKWGYDEVMTPTLEYDETVGEASATLDNKLFKLLDKDGQTLVLRPDMTTPIARVVSSVMRKDPLPLRLSYGAPIFRAQENGAGRNAEFKQMGVELIGDGSPDGDAEMLALAVESLKTCAIRGFKLAIGHVGFLNAFLGQRLADAEVIERLKRKLSHHDYVGYRRLVEQLSLARSAKVQLLDLLTWHGDGRILQDRLKELGTEDEVHALHHMRKLWDALEMYGVTSHMMLDLAMIGKMGYYTGVYFEGYTEDHGFPLLSGGRYDALLAQFGRPAAAVGFQLKLDRVLEVSPLTHSTDEHVLIVYEPSQRRKALHLAAKWRRQHYRVTMQVNTELKEATMPKLRKRYDDIIVLRRETSDET